MRSGTGMLSVHSPADDTQHVRMATAEAAATSSSGSSPTNSVCFRGAVQNAQRSAKDRRRGLPQADLARDPDVLKRPVQSRALQFEPLSHRRPVTDNPELESPAESADQLRDSCIRHDSVRQLALITAAPATRGMLREHAGQPREELSPAGRSGGIVRDHPAQSRLSGCCRAIRSVPTDHVGTPTPMRGVAVDQGVVEIEENRGQHAAIVPARAAPSRTGWHSRQYRSVASPRRVEKWRSASRADG